MRVTADGDRGTLHFECHYVDAKGKTVVVYLTADQEVARINEVDDHRHGRRISSAHALSARGSRE